MSCSIALRRSPKPGALTAATLRPPRSLLTTRVASASPSTSSAMISSGLPDWITNSSSGTIGCSDDELLLVDQDDRVLELGDHLVGVGDEVGAEVAAVELHAAIRNGTRRYIDITRAFVVRSAIAGARAACHSGRRWITCGCCDASRRPCSTGHVDEDAAASWTRTASVECPGVRPPAPHPGMCARRAARAPARRVAADGGTHTPIKRCPIKSCSMCVIAAAHTLERCVRCEAESELVDGRWQGVARCCQWPNCDGEEW